MSSTQLSLFSWFSSLQMPWSKDDTSSSKDGKEEEVWGSGNKNSMDKNKDDNKSGLGGVAGIMDSMENFKTAQQVGKMTNSLVQDLASTTIEGVAVEGKVKVYVDGQQRPLNVQIDEGYLAGVDSSDLSAALAVAMKDAYRKSSERMDDKMKSFYVDLGLK
ncbi:Nucleoid-associated protein [Seminavis robusta]|uniref:Nucleoid-associated protein n=1 Tax=Seminavis robusta TaxID=568900 RepID=A0A9N8HRP6_9STRA|nr:Nucleoid-associated protein [Seminavis robusta]|eukprot:Sro1601_g285220.1 Nucleoid-associated protein (161) ;mRNA; r:24504-24986